MHGHTYRFSIYHIMDSLYRNGYDNTLSKYYRLPRSGEHFNSLTIQALNELRKHR